MLLETLRTKGFLRSSPEQDCSDKEANVLRTQA